MIVEQHHVVTESASGRLSRKTDFVGWPFQQGVIWRSQNTFWGDERPDVHLTLDGEAMIALVCHELGYRREP